MPPADSRRRTRFAPAPTGYLHLGHLANALYVWGLAAHQSADVLLRIEDHDRQRCRPEFETALLEDLEWLGLCPTLGALSDYGAGPSPYRQSDNHAIYEAFVSLLRDRGHHVYVCECSRRDLSGQDGAPAGRETPYAGHCRDRGLAPAPGRGLRVVLEPGEEAFQDLRLGVRHQDPARQCGDLLLQDRLGNWTYQFAVVVDDLRHGIDLVIRGEDLLESTGRQIRLARMLGREVPPSFLHHGLIRKPGGRKLSKADQDTSLRALRAAGARPEGLFGRALHGLGLAATARPLPFLEALGHVTRS
jgi:glutamyl/glutaminyl-tRNA synthetase